MEQMVTEYAARKKNLRNRIKCKRELNLEGKNKKY